MKKLGISLVALMIGLPTMAHATISDISNAGTVTTNTNVATTSYVKGAYNAMASAVNTAIGQANTDIAAKQNQLKNDAGTPANIADTVKTSVATTGASDTVLVTEKAVRDAIDAAQGATTYTQGSGISISNNEISASGITTSNIDANAGIVATQLSSGVQTSLGKADSALQSTDLDGTTIEKDSTTNKVQVVAGSIGTTQLASGVVTSLGKADTALQSNSALNGANLTAGTVAESALDSSVQAKLSAADSAIQAADLAEYGFAVWGDWNDANSTGNVTVTDVVPNP